MKRNFSHELLYEAKKTSKIICTERPDSISAFISLATSAAGDQKASEAAGYLCYLNRHMQEVIQRNNELYYAAEKVFDEIYSIDSLYAGKLKEILDSSRCINEILIKMEQIIRPGNSYISSAQEAVILKKAFLNYELILNGCEKTVEELEKQLNELIEKLPAEDKTEIRRIIFSADDPYKKIYLSELQSYTIGNISGKKTGYFTALHNTINVDMSEEKDNPRGAYTTFFHESGHAIDYNYFDDGKFYSVTYKTDAGISLMDAVYEDVRNDVAKTVSGYTNDTKVINNLTDYIMDAGFTDIDSLSATEKMLLKNVKNYYSEDMKGAVNEACSDIYGGVTNNIIIGSYGHRKPNYWYTSDGKPTLAQAKELWAEYYSYCITGNEKALTSLREHFPKGSSVLDEMAKDMADGW